MTLEELRQEALALKTEAAGYVARCDQIKREANVVIAAALLGMGLAVASVWLFPPWMNYTALAMVFFAIGWNFYHRRLLRRIRARIQGINARLAELDEILKTHFAGGPPWSL